MILEASLTQKIAMSDPAGELTAPPGPLAGLRARERRGGVREEEEEGRGGKRKGGRGGEGKETLCPSFNS